MQDFYFIDKNSGFLNLFCLGLRLNDILVLSPIFFLVLLLLIPLALSFLVDKAFAEDEAEAEDFDDDKFTDDDTDNDEVFFLPLILICIKLPKSFKSEYNIAISIGSCLGLYKYSTNIN
jgi:hypothetical protein